MDLHPEWPNARAACDAHQRRRPTTVRSRFPLLALLGLTVALTPTPSRAAPEGPPCDPCDANCDAARDLLDLPPFVAVLLGDAAPCAPCAGDVDGDGQPTGLDIQLFVECLVASPRPPVGACCAADGGCTVTTSAECAGLWLGPGTTCAAGACPAGNLTAYRPRHGAGYFPFTKTAVSEADEMSGTTGPGIRVNAPGDADPQGEDDLIELLVERSAAAHDLALRRTNGALRVWTTPNKSPGTEVPFVSDRTDALPFPPGGATMTFWVEWAVAAHGTADLALEPLAAPLALDTVRFHTFRSIVMALGGENQSPTVPVDLNHGTFVVGTALYQRGYDVHMHDEDDVSAAGTGAAYNCVVDAIANRGVDEVCIFGYSHGGGSTHDLAERLDIDRPGIGVFEIVVTSYVDGIENDSDFDVTAETRRPPSTGYHANHYQRGSIADVFLDGGPVPDSDPPPTGLDVETTPWGAGVTHYEVDDLVQVRAFIEDNFVIRLTP